VPFTDEAAIYKSREARAGKPGRAFLVSFGTCSRWENYGTENYERKTTEAVYEPRVSPKVPREIGSDAAADTLDPLTARGTSPSRN
jgi:hypothetical protein